MHADDVKLVGRLRAGDQRAFREFFDDYFPRLFRFALRRMRGEEESARDAVQASLTQAVRKLQTYRGEASLFTWLCQIARHEIGARATRSERDRSFVGRLADLEDDRDTRALIESLPADSAEGPEASQEREEIAALVHTALDYLPSRYAAVLELKYLEDLPVEAIGERLGLTAIAVQSLLARARQAFRDVETTLLPSLGAAR